jgi:dTMP kinase
MKRGLFIVLEGAEGSGKSTQAQLLAAWLAQAGVPYRLTREPGGTTLGEALRSLVLHGEPMSVETELLLVLAARSAHVRDVVQPALAAGQIVVCDRYELSTFAYQALGRGLELEKVKTLNEFATGGLRADLTIVVDVPLDVGSARRASSRTGDDRIESGGREFLTRVTEAYRLLSRERKDVVLVDGTASAEAIQAEIRGLLKTRFPETFALVQG